MIAFLSVINYARRTVMNTTPKKGVAGEPKASLRSVDVKEGAQVSTKQDLIAKAAYFHAEKRGFVPGNELQDWLEAEKELAEMA
jgi:hypothetical protein